MEKDNSNKNFEQNIPNPEKDESNSNDKLFKAGILFAVILLLLVFCVFLLVVKTDLGEKILSKSPAQISNLYLKIKNENIKQSVKERLEEELNMRQPKYNIK